MASALVLHNAHELQPKEGLLRKVSGPCGTVASRALRGVFRDCRFE